MLDWQITEEELAERGDSAPGGRQGVSWRWLLAALLLLALLGAGGVRWRFQQQRATMRADLEAFILTEERAQRFGLVEELPALVLDKQQSWWRVGYRRAFERGAQEPVELELGPVEWGETQALATVLLDGVPHLRSYELTRRGWRRSQIAREQWGETVALPVSDALHLDFRERDAPFAEQLAADLPALLASADQWEVRLSVNRVEISPQEFAAPLLQNYPRVVTINSPLLVRPRSGLASESIVRLALADALFFQTGPLLRGESPLPGAARLLEAARTLVALRWALSPEEQAQVEERWREQVSTGSVESSPLYSPATPDTPLDPLRPAPADGAALLLISYIEQVWGVEKVVALVRGIAADTPWDALFQEELGLSTAEVERLAAAYARGGLTAAATARQEPPQPVPALVVAGTVLPREGSGERFFLQGTDLPQPVAIEPVGRWLDAPGFEELLPATCAGLFAEVRAEGEWLEGGRRLRATRLSLPYLEPALRPELSGLPPTTGTLALLAEGPEEAPHTLHALDNAGTLHPLLDLRPFRASWPVRPHAGEPQQWLLEWGIPGCAQSWLFLFDATGGIKGQWLLAPDFGSGPLRAFARPEQEDILFARHLPPSDERLGTWVLGTIGFDARPLRMPERMLADSLEPLGWRREGLLIRFSMGEEDAIGTLATGGSTVTNVATIGGKGPLLSPLYLHDDALYYLTPQSFDTILGANLNRLVVSSGEQSTLLWISPDALLFVDLPGVAGGFFVAERSPAAARTPLFLRLLRFDPSDRTDVTHAVILEHPALLTALACDDGSALYLLRQEGLLRLRHWHPDGRDALLLEQEEPFTLWACGS